MQHADLQFTCCLLRHRKDVVLELKSRYQKLCSETGRGNKQNETVQEGRFHMSVKAHSRRELLFLLFFVSLFFKNVVMDKISSCCAGNLEACYQ